MNPESHYKISYGCLFRDIEDYLRKWINGGLTDKKYAEQMLQLLNVHGDNPLQVKNKKIDMRSPIVKHLTPWLNKDYEKT